ncbi:hypothetical protein [Microbacterium aurantiacum]|uniref:hypothetical protein n=1 Tax=Microbacterium aurantiacum TaxID=162393 RepID=UPI003435522E
MVISSVGYPGTVDAEQWAQLVFRVGSARYGVDSYASWRVQTTAGTRAIQIPTGSGWGYGVRDISDSPETLNLSSVPTGTRWDLIVVRRNWSTGETTFAVVEGGSSRSIPARATSGGDIDEQPLALVRVDSGSSVVGEIVDLRVMCDLGGVIAFDELALSYLGFAGAELWIDGRVWRRIVGPTGVSTWASEPRGDTGWLAEGVSFSVQSGWRLDGYRMRKIGDRVTGYLTITRTAGTVSFNSETGDIGTDPVLLTVSADWRPTTFTRPLLIRRPGTRDYAGNLETDGRVRITHAPLPASDITQGVTLVAYLDFQR